MNSGNVILTAAEYDALVSDLAVTRHRLEEARLSNDAAASLFMAIDTVGPDRRVEIPPNWFAESNRWLSEHRAGQGE